MSNTQATIDAQLAPRVTKDQVKNFIVAEQYHQFPGTLLTVCVLTLKNGFTVTGESACASAANFNAQVGRDLAKEQAMEKVWSHLGFELRSQLHLIENATPPSMPDADMLTYVGTKVVHACPMTRASYNELRGWELPADEDGNDEGYLVEYADGGKPNVPGFKGYISWSPKDVFEKAYTTGCILKKTTYVERMEQEMTDLHQKCIKLADFIKAPAFSSLDQREQSDLREQQVAMDNYSWILGARIRRAQNKEAQLG